MITAKNERFPKFASTGNLTGNLMFQGVRYLRMCIIPITFPEKLGNVYGNVLECCPFLCFFFPEISDFYLISVTRNLRKLNFFLLCRWQLFILISCSYTYTVHCKNKRVTFNQIGLAQLQHQCQTMCIQADQLHCLISIGSKQLNHVQWSAGLVLLRTLFNIETATVVTLSVESYLLFLQCI